MDKIKKAFRDFFGFNLDTINNSGTINKNGLSINYVLDVDLSKNIIMDLLIFKNDALPPVHKRINYDGVIIDLENFQFSIIYQTKREKKEKQEEMIRNNKKTADIIIKKGLAKKTEKWISNYAQ